MTNVDIELECWRNLWQGVRNDAALDLRERVNRQTRRLQYFMLAPVLVTVIMGGGFLIRAAAAPNAESIGLAAAVWVFLAAAWAAGLVNSRGTWQPLGHTTAAYLDLSVRRCRGTLNGLVFAAALYVSELVFLVAWQVLAPVERPATLRAVLTSPVLVVLGWLGVPALLALVVWYRRRKREELAHFLDLQRQLN